MKRPDGALVADAWLKLVAADALDLPASCVGTTLPAARGADGATPAAWTTHGFVQHTVVGGAPGIHVPIRRTVVQVDCWAVTLDSRSVPWGRASGLAEGVWTRAYLETTQERTLSVPAGYAPPMLKTVIPLTDPRRIADDGAGFARFQMDLEFNWTPSTLE